MESIVYDALPLAAGGRSIRLLDLLPGSLDAELKATLRCVELPKKRRKMWFETILDEGHNEGHLPGRSHISGAEKHPIFDENRQALSYAWGDGRDVTLHGKSR